MDALQRISFQEPPKEKIPLPGFSTISVDAHADKYFAEKVTQHEYLSDSLATAEEILSQIISRATTFIEPENCADIPVQLSINTNPNRPYEWSVSRIFPSTVDWDNATQSTGMEKIFHIKKSTDGIYRRTFSITTQVSRWGKNDEFLGIYYGIPQVSSTISSYALLDPDLIDFDLHGVEVNSHTTQVSITTSKDTNNTKLYEYNMTSVMKVD